MVQFNYTGEEMTVLLNQLEDNGWDTLYSLLQDSSSEGLSAPGNMRDAATFIELERYYPNVPVVFGIPLEDLPLYLNEKVYPVENQIASWRLKIGK